MPPPAAFAATGHTTFGGDSFIIPRNVRRTIAIGACFSCSTDIKIAVVLLSLLAKLQTRSRSIFSACFEHVGVPLARLAVVHEELHSLSRRQNTRYALRILHSKTTTASSRTAFHVRHKLLRRLFVHAGISALHRVRDHLASTKAEFLQVAGPPNRYKASSGQMSRNFETFTTKLETPSCNFTSTKLSQSANKLHEDLAKAFTDNQKQSSALGLLFHSVLSQRTVADFTLTSCRLSLLLSVKLEAFSTA